MDMQITPRFYAAVMPRMGFVVAACVGLAACGGGGGAVTSAPTIPTPPAGPATPATPGTPETGAQMRSSVATLISDISPISYTALGSVQTTGSATYNGYLYGNLANTSDAVTDSLIGDMAMQVTFTATSVTVGGTVSNFAAADDSALSGSLALSAGKLNRNGNPFNDATLTVAASGTLTDSGNRALVVGAQLEGDFLGGTFGAVGGEALGRVTVNGVSQEFNGGFVGAR